MIPTIPYEIDIKVGYFCGTDSEAKISEESL
jgi:hypothetical protein